MIKIFTIGYEASTPDDFIATLKLMKVDLLLDVRELPMSRRKGFAKTALTNLLNKNGINYQHEKLLGSPRAIRHQLREDKDLEKFFVDFNEYIGTKKDILERVSSSLVGNVVLMCYERDYKTCHRKVVAKKLGELLGIRPRHIGVKKGVSEQHKENEGLDFSQSVPAV
jgi:uncharacterized protein (DUF488 family)